MYWYENILSGKPENESKYSNLTEFKYFKWLENQIAGKSYQLICDNKTIGSLVFIDQSKRSAIGKICGKEFLINRHRFFPSRITINQKGNLRKSKMSITGFNKHGTLDIKHEEKILWIRLKHLENEWAFTEGNNQKKIVFKPISSFYKSGYLVEIKNKSINEETMAILLLLGIFNLVTMDEETGLASVFI